MNVGFGLFGRGVATATRIFVSCDRENRNQTSYVLCARDLESSWTEVKAFANSELGRVDLGSHGVMQ